MKKVYINGVGSISAQNTFDAESFLEEITDYESNVVSAIDPEYKNYIPPAAARRMAKGIKMGVVASKLAMDEAAVEQVDAIITGTGMGCLNDSEKFVSAIIDNHEEFLTPTSFIQSTHNTVGGQIALGLGCKGYNFTYVHSAISFESAVLDAMLQLQTAEAENILVGGVDELAPHTVNIHKLIHHVKAENVKTSQLFESKTEGAVFSEGANFFVLSSEKNKNCYAEIKAVEMFNTLTKENLAKTAIQLLKENNLKIEDVDILITGNNGDVTFDGYFDVLTEGIFSRTAQVHYKHIIGEFNTASSFALWLAAKMIKEQTIPKVVQKNALTPSKVKNILLYNQYRAENHSFVLLTSC